MPNQDQAPPPPGTSTHLHKAVCSYVKHSTAAISAVTSLPTCLSCCKLNMCVTVIIALQVTNPLLLQLTLFKRPQPLIRFLMVTRIGPYHCSAHPLLTLCLVILSDTPESIVHGILQAWCNPFLVFASRPQCPYQIFEYSMGI